MATISELAFEQFCRENAIDYCRIETGPQQTPDYELICDGYQLIAEVKQIDENDLDQEQRRILQTRTTTAYFANSDGLGLKLGLKCQEPMLSVPDTLTLSLASPTFPVRR